VFHPDRFAVLTFSVFSRERNDIRPGDGMSIFQLFQPKALITAALILGTPVVVGLLATLTGLAATPAVAVDVIGFDRRWIVSVDEARALIASDALVLDARDSALQSAAPLAQAQSVRWRDLADPAGQLLENDSLLTSRLQALGVDAVQPIVVVGDPVQGLGEDARVVWALRSLGHSRIVLVDGGAPALLAAGLPTIQPPFGHGSFVVDRKSDWAIDTVALKALQRKRDATILAGSLATELLSGGGRLKTRGEIDAFLAAKGIDRDTLLATDGKDTARDAWLTAVLVDAGYNARNLVGTAEYPLTAAN
jgi:thiosulfate/3-mercaptopyruvate sulfurtransferase